MEFLVFNQTTDPLRGFEPFFHFDVKTKKLYFVSLIFLASKKSLFVDVSRSEKVLKKTRWFSYFDVRELNKVVFFSLLMC